jgi:hypothetical protein
MKAKVGQAVSPVVRTEGGNALHGQGLLSSASVLWWLFKDAADLPVWRGRLINAGP